MEEDIGPLSRRERVRVRAVRDDLILALQLKPALR